MSIRVVLLGVILVVSSPAASGLRGPAHGQAEPRPERPRPASAPAEPTGQARLRREVTTLASAEYAGRQGEGGRKAAAHLVARFQELGLEPGFGDRYEQPIPGDGPGGEQGRNVGARFPGADAERRDEWIILAAHFDHLGIRNGVLYPGADDNATGVAMMLEVARELKQGPARPPRSVMLIGFDLEEVGLFGSRYFVEHSPVPLDRVRLFITADMIGRALGGVCTSSVFVMGTEHAPGLRPWIEAAAQGEPLNVGMLGSDLLVLNRSDYGPFRARKIPYLFFSTGENPCYHSPRDTADTVDYVKLAAISRTILGVVRQAAGAPVVPPWSAVPDNPLAEVAAVRDVLRTLLEHRDELRIAPGQTLLMTNTLRSLDAIVARGAITPAERTAMVNVARIVLLSVF
jgi:hypothetical protein